MPELNQGKLFFSNHLEVLLELLIEEISGKDPFYTPRIIIPSREMGRWIRREITNRLGVAANIQTLFFHDALQYPLLSPLDLTFALYAQIAHLPYVQGNDRRRILLAHTLARLFQRYAMYGVTFLPDWQKELWEAMNIAVDFVPKGAFHVFAFSHIPEKLFHAFSASTFYFVSPCEGFWSDATQYDHILLGSCGKVGRKSAAMIEESGMTTAEYPLPPAGPSALHALQRNMLTLDRSAIPSDSSIQLHVVASRKREIEVLYHELSRMAIAPQDVLIMAPDITLYKPYIEGIFENYQIADMPAVTNPQVKGLQLLLNVQQRRYTTRAFLELYRHPLFYRRWKEEEIDRIASWMVETGIRWGIDGAYRNQLLHTDSRADACEERGTFEGGFEQLLEGLALEGGIAFTEAELLGEWIETVRAIYAARAEGILSAEQWVDYIQYLCCTFFVQNDEQLWLFERLRILRKKETMTFDAFCFLMDESLKGESLTINPNQLQVYRFSSMLPMRSIPAQLIWLLGMDQDSFPRLDRHFAFDLSRNSHTYSPSRVDFDRYLFLESILSAREMFVMSFIGRDPIDNQEKPPSSCISDLLEHVAIPVVEHPAQGYEMPVTESDYRLAVALQQKEKMPFSLLGGCFSPMIMPEEVIDITQLLRLARSPLQYYFAHKLGMRFSENTVIKEEEEFTLSPLTMAKLRSSALKESLDVAIMRTKKRGDYPLGMFAKVADLQCAGIRENKREVIEWHEHVKQPVRINDQLWHYPAIRIGSLTIVGRVEGIEEGQLYIPKVAHMKNLVAHWPLLLLFEKVSFMDTTIAIKQPLEPFLRYCVQARERPSFLLPHWVQAIAAGDSAALQRAMEEERFDQAWLWCSAGRTYSPENVIEEWQSVAQELFGAIL